MGSFPGSGRHAACRAGPIGEGKAARRPRTTRGGGVAPPPGPGPVPATSARSSVLDRAAEVRPKNRQVFAGCKSRRAHPISTCRPPTPLPVLRRLLSRASSSPFLLRHPRPASRLDGSRETREKVARGQLGRGGPFPARWRHLEGSTGSAGSSRFLLAYWSLKYHSERPAFVRADTREKCPSWTSCPSCRRSTASRIATFYTSYLVESVGSGSAHGGPGGRLRFGIRAWTGEAWAATVSGAWRPLTQTEGEIHKPAGTEFRAFVWKPR